MIYIDESNEQITIDSESVFRKALLQAINSATPENLSVKKVTLRIIVSQPVNLEKSDLTKTMFQGGRTERGYLK